LFADLSRRRGRRDALEGSDVTPTACARSPPRVEAKPSEVALVAVSRRAQ